MHYRSLLAELIQARSIINDGGGTLDLSSEMLVWLTLHTDEGLAAPQSDKLEPWVDLPTKEKHCADNRVSVHTDQTPQWLGPLNQVSTTVTEASATLLTKSAPTVTQLSGAQIAKSSQARATQLVEMKEHLPS